MATHAAAGFSASWAQTAWMISAGSVPGGKVGAAEGAAVLAGESEASAPAEAEAWLFD